MKLISIEVENFRQFYGKQSLSFTSDEAKNVTVVHGENGSGKTTLLNALIWCLYNHTTHDFENSDKLLNERLYDELATGDKGMARVALVFDDDGQKYCAERKVEYVKSSSPTAQNSRFELQITSPNGESKKPENPQARINQILPEEMLNYFFFNGERMEKLSQKKNAGEIQKAIKTMLGLTLLERSDEHLGLVQKRLRKNLQEHGLVDAKEKNLIAELEQKENEKTAKKKQYDVHQSNAEALRVGNDEIQKRLRALEGSSALQKHRDDVSNEIEHLSIQKEEIGNRIADFVRVKGYASFTGRLFESTEGVLNDLKARRVLPADVKENFIRELLKELKCVCGREIGPGSPEFRSIEKLLETSGREDVGNALSKFQRESFLTQQDLKGNPSALSSLIAQKAELEIQSKKKEEIRDEISVKLKNFEGKEDVSRLESKLQENEAKIRFEETARIRLISEIESLEAEIKILQKAQDKIEGKGEDGKKLKGQLDAAVALQNCAKEIYSFHIGEIRRSLAAKIDMIFQKICKKNYSIRMNEDFTLDVLNNQSGTPVIVSKGTGENQITSLSFVGSLLDYARERSKIDASKSELTYYGGIYPLVMDSPFGSLDSDYRNDIATYIPKLSPQVAVFVSTTQWRGEVEQALSPRIGKRYIVVNYTTKKKQPVILDVGGTRYELVKDSEKYEHSQIIEVT